MNVLVYIRVSGKAQVDGDGPDRQRAAAFAFASKFGLTVLGVFEDGGVSGETAVEERPGFMEMVERIQLSTGSEQPIGGIIIERMDRLARDLMVQEVSLKVARDLGVKVFAADRGELEDVSSNDVDPTRVLLRQVLGALAQWEKAVIVRKLRISREKMRRETGRCEGKKPYGTHPQERAVLDFISRSLQLDPGIRPAELTRVMNDYGLTMRNGKPFDVERVSKLYHRVRKEKTV